ncbi:MAG: M23 family metallopeptidase [Lachnospiraceae bacterium]|nr:M23 family metallopeptidase [Lachnospiraceae bacterium]
MQVTPKIRYRENGTYSDHVKIAGTAGDEIYAVADGVVPEVAFESYSGNFIVVDMVVISPDGQIPVTPVRRFQLGEDENGRNFLRRKILGIDAVTGELIWEERGNTL